MPKPLSGALLLRSGRFFFKYREVVFPAVLLALLLGARPAPLFGRAAWDPWVDALGLGLVFLGQLLRALVIGFAYVKRGGKNKQVYARELVQEGFFSLSRNPLYVGNLAVILGFFLIHGALPGFLLGLPFFALAYQSIVMAEEDYLRERFQAEYAAYCRRVPRFLPTLHRAREALKGMSFDWRLVVRKDYGTIFVNFSCALLLILWEHWGKLDRTSLGTLMVLWALLGAGFILAWSLKKSGRLRPLPKEDGAS